MFVPIRAVFPIYSPVHFAFASPISPISNTCKGTRQQKLEQHQHQSRKPKAKAIPRNYPNSASVSIQIAPRRLEGIASLRRSHFATGFGVVGQGLGGAGGQTTLTPGGAGGIGGPPAPPGLVAWVPSLSFASSEPAGHAITVYVADPNHPHGFHHDRVYVTGTLGTEAVHTQSVHHASALTISLRTFASAATRRQGAPRSRASRRIHNPCHDRRPRRNRSSYGCRVNWIDSKPCNPAGHCATWLLG